MNNNALKTDNDWIDNIWSYLIFGFIFTAVIVVISSVYTDYDNVIDACDVSHANNSNYVNMVVKCGKAKLEYINRDTNRFYALFFIGIFSIIIGAYVAKVSHTETYKTIGRSLVINGLALISFFILFDTTVINYVTRLYIFSFTMGVTIAFIFYSLLESELI